MDESKQAIAGRSRVNAQCHIHRETRLVLRQPEYPLTLNSKTARSKAAAALAGAAGPSTPADSDGRIAPWQKRRNDHPKHIWAAPGPNRHAVS